jgi:hypothetical protein
MPRNGSPRDELTILRHREEITRRYLRGESEGVIAAALGVSQQTVSKDLRFLLESWEPYAAESIAKRKAVELKRIDRLQTMYEAAWERSCRKQRTTVAERVQEAPELRAHPEQNESAPEDELAAGVDQLVQRNHDDPKPDFPQDQHTPVLRQKQYLREEMRDGNPTFLAGIHWCISERLKIMGGYAPAAHHLAGAGGGTIEITSTGPASQPGTMSVMHIIDRLSAVLALMPPDERSDALDDYKKMRESARSLERRLMALPLANAALAPKPF